MASSSDKNVFIQVQGVLNEDWISSSGKKLTEVLEEIEKIEDVEIRFQRGTHVIHGTLDQLLEAQNLLLGKVRAPSSKETAPKNSPKDLETGGELKTDSHDTFVKAEYPHETHTFVKAEYPHETHTFVKAEYPHETHQPTELMVDRDIWDYIESKKQNDVRQLEDVFEAVITKVEDESGVLKLILKKKLHKTGNDNLELMLESLGALYEETAMVCVTETAQFQLSDEERELAMEHISAQFFEVLVKKCIYSNDVLFIGPLYGAREARQQFQTLARRLVNGELRTPGDKRGHQSSYPKYPHEHPHGAINPNDYEDAGLYNYQYSNRFDGPRDDFSSMSKYGKDNGAVDVDDGRTMYHQHDKHNFYDDYSWNKKPGNGDVLKGNLSKKLQSDTVKKFQKASHDKHLCDDPGQKTRASNSKTEDIISSLENLNLEEACQGKDINITAAEGNANDPSNSSTDSTALTKATKKTKKVKSQSYEFPKVTIVKPKFEAVHNPDILNEPSVSSDSRKLETGHTQWKHNVEKKPYDSPSSSDSEAHQKVSKNAEKKRVVGPGNGQEKGGDKNTKELASQETFQNILENVENSEDKADMEELVKRGTGNHAAEDNMKIIQPSAINKKEVLPQPADGTIACIIDKGFHLNGCPKSGTIEISMTFEAGIQGADQPEPGRPYRGMKLKAFLPASGDGREVLRLTKSAFAARKLFQIKRNELEGEFDIIVPNGVFFKEATDQFPDPEYLPNVTEQLKRLTE